jgi:hypothetical protein
VRRPSKPMRRKSRRRSQSWPIRWRCDSTGCPSSLSIHRLSKLAGGRVVRASVDPNRPYFGMARPFNRGFGLALKAQSCSPPRREGHADASLTLASSSLPPASSRRTLTSAFSAKRSRAADDEVVMRLQLSKQLLLIDTDARRRWFSGRTRRSWSARPDPESQVRIRLPAGGGSLVRTRLWRWGFSAPGNYGRFRGLYG